MAFKEYEDLEELRQLQLISADILAEFDRVCKELGIEYFLYAGTALGAIRHKGFIPWDDDIDLGMRREEYERFMKEAPSIVGREYEVVSIRNEKDFPACNANLALAHSLCVPEEFDDCPYQYKIGLGIYPMDKVSADPRIYKKQHRRTWFWGRLNFLRATPCPHTGLTGAANVVANGVFRVTHWFLRTIGPSSVFIQEKWEKAARLAEFERTTPETRYAEFLDRDPLKWSIAEKDLRPMKTAEFEGRTYPIPRNVGALLERCYSKDYMQLPPEDQRKNHYPSKLCFDTRVAGD